MSSLNIRPGTSFGTSEKHDSRQNFTLNPFVSFESLPSVTKFYLGYHKINVTDRS